MTITRQGIFISAFLLLSLTAQAVHAQTCQSKNCLWGILNPSTCLCDCIGEAFVPTGTSGYCKDSTGSCSIVREWVPSIGAFRPCPPLNGGGGGGGGGGGVVRPTYRFTSPPPGGVFQWDTRSVQVVSWVVENAAPGETVQLFFVQVGGAGLLPITTAPIPAGSVAFTWAVPATLNPSTWNIKLVSSSGVELFNSARIEIRALIPASGYRFTSPTTAGVTWNTKTGQSISWDVVNRDSNTEQVTLTLFKLNSAVPDRVITTIAAKELFFTWNIPGELAAGEYFIRLVSSGGVSIDTKSINIAKAFW